MLPRRGLWLLDQGKMRRERRLQHRPGHKQLPRMGICIVPPLDSSCAVKRRGGGELADHLGGSLSGHRLCCEEPVPIPPGFYDMKSVRRTAPLAYGLPTIGEFGSLLAVRGKEFRHENVRFAED